MLQKHHIIPKHMGGSDDQNNTVMLTPSEHAEAHRLLFEQYGHWQDYVLWQGLLQFCANFDTTQEVWTGKSYRITSPQPVNTVEIVEDLYQWCLDRNYDANAFVEAAMTQSMTHGGFLIEEV